MSSPTAVASFRRVFSEISMSEIESPAFARSAPRHKGRLQALQRIAGIRRRTEALVSNWKGRYRLHESLLLLFYSRKATALGDEERLFNPLARWRTKWRSFGIVLLVIHIISAAASAWVVHRCDADALCERRCPSLWEWLTGSQAEQTKQLLVGTWPAWTGLQYILPPPGAGIAYGCRRALLSEASSIGVRASSLR